MALVRPPAPNAPRRRRWRKAGQVTLGLRYGCAGSLALVLLFSVTCAGLQGAAMFSMGPWVFLLALFLATLTAVPYGLVLWWLDRNEKERLSLIATAVLWGAVVATLFSMVFNTGFLGVATALTGSQHAGGQLTASFAAPFFEELSKGAAVALIFLLFRRDFDNVLDGVLYGALVGLGFAWFENVTYYVMEARNSGADGMVKLAWVRGLLNGLSSHAAYTGLTGLGFGLVRVLRRGVLRWLLVPFFWTTAMFAHFLWNTFVGAFIFDPRSEAAVYLVSIPVAVAVLELPFVGLLGIVVLAVWRQENAVIRGFLSREPPDVVPPGEAEVMVPARRRAWREIRAFFTAGPLRWWHLRRLHRELVLLAFARWHHHEDDETTWSADEDGEILELRERVRGRRAKMAKGAKPRGQ